MPTEKELEYERHEARVRYSRDHRMYVKMGGQLAVYLEKGILIGRIRHCQQLLQVPLTPLDELIPLRLYDLEIRGDELDEQLKAKESSAAVHRPTEKTIATTPNSSL